MSADATYRKFRDADDAQGNMSWAAKMSRKALQQERAAGGEAIEAPYEMSTEERIVWRLLKVPRKYMDLENLGVLSAEKMRGVLRGLVAAEVVAVLELSEGKPIVPLEVKRHKAKIEGTADPTKNRSKLKARVYRPDISGAASSPPPAAAQAAPTPAPKPAAPARPAAGPKKRADLDAEGRQVVDLVEQLATKADEGDWYAFLGVPRQADAGAIKKAYMGRARDLHPDRIASTGAGDVEGIRDKADELFKKLQNAYGVLNDEKKRAIYDSELASGKNMAAPGGGKVRRPEEAKLMLRKGQHLLQAKDYVRAYQQLRMAVDFDDSLDEAKVWYAWALYFHDGKDEAERTDKAKKQLRALADEKSNAEAAYRLALIARKEGHAVEHEKRIKQAVRHNPDHREATQEKRVLERRRNSTSDKPDDKKGGGGLFGRFKR